jgi:hypothetical protein
MLANFDPPKKKKFLKKLKKLLFVFPILFIIPEKMLGFLFGEKKGLFFMKILGTVLTILMVFNMFLLKY